MWKVLVLTLFWGCLGALAETGVMGRLYWCDTLCMCETDTNEQVKCFQEDEIYELLNFSARSVKRLRRINWALQGTVDWCSDLCLCNIQTEKRFECTEPEQLTQLILDNIGNAYFLVPEEETTVKGEEERPVDVEEQEDEAALNQDEGHKKRSDRKKNRKHRKPKKNQRNRHEEEETHSRQIPEPVPEPESEPVPEPTSPFAQTQTPAPHPATSAGQPEHFGYNVNDEVEVIEPLPKQEAVAASPAVTALQPPTRQGQSYTTAESYTPGGGSRELEGLSPRIQPIVEITKEKKTTASMVSQDLEILGSTVRNIEDDVMFNQHLLLVTTAIAGVAMLGVLILAVISCTSRRQKQGSDVGKKVDRSKDGNQSPKMNLEQAW